MVRCQYKKMFQDRTEAMLFRPEQYQSSTRAGAICNCDCRAVLMLGNIMCVARACFAFGSTRCVGHV